MKKTLAILVLVLLPTLAFSDLLTGITAMYNFPLTGETISKTEDASILDYTFGVDTRLNLDPFTLGLYVLYTPGYGYEFETVSYEFPSITELYPDIGLTLNLLDLIRLSGSVGPSFYYYLFEGQEYEDTSPVKGGLHFRATTDLYLGDIVLSGVFLTDFGFFEEQLDSGKKLREIEGYFGVSVLFKLF